MPPTPQPLYYTFGNHMHWVDMEWLWGYPVLPSSARDMLRFCAATGAKGQLNFDGVGYEKLAVEAPEVLAELRQAVAAGQVEVAGASYGQPYGLFHGGESNVRQRIYGARAVRRLLGVWPRTFWEEEFDFFPQLPQILRGAGFEYASLFFQWTWHTPHVPPENAPAVWWAGQDGSRLLAAPRGPLNLHQWPEDFAGLLESPLLRQAQQPLLLQWLELMPSPDWMCRAELMLPPLQALQANPAFELRFVTLPEYLDQVRDQAVPRAYRLDDVFHGMSLGKNGDLFRRQSRQAEQQLLTAEALSALSGFCGRPYPSWDVYPAWELEEAWRELLAAQHHDNDECEGLCGHVGLCSYERSQGLSQHVVQRTVRRLAERTAGPPGRTVVFNPLGWPRRASVTITGQARLVADLPPFGYRVLAGPEAARPLEQVTVEETAGLAVLRRGSLAVTLDRVRGVITQITSPDFPEGVLRAEVPLGDLEMVRGGAVERFETVTTHVAEADGSILVERAPRAGAPVRVCVRLAPELDAVELDYEAEQLPRPDPRMHASLQTSLAVNLPAARLIHDHPYGLSEVGAQGSYRRKYPTGDWMTSPQVFEDVHNPFTALQLLDLTDGQRGLLYLHDGSQAFFRADTPAGLCVRNILSMYDAWDEDYFVARLQARFRLVPHGPLAHAQRWRLAQEFTRPALAHSTSAPAGDLPQALAGAWCDAPNVAVSAFYREMDSAGAGLDAYAGAGLGYPYLLRLVELDGQPAEARLRLPGPVAAAFKTNLLGVPEARLPAAPAAPPLPGLAEWSLVNVSLRPFEIATLYLDLPLGRKRTRDLDAYRHVWARAHK